MAKNEIEFVFFGSSVFSQHVLKVLESRGFTPVLNITSAKEPIPIDKLREVKVDVFIVASFGKILPAEVIYMPPHKTLNVHPSLLPKLRGPSPIQSTILTNEQPGVTIMRMDEEVDHGPLLAERVVNITPWPDRYNIVEEKLGQAGGELLADILPRWVKKEIEEQAQDESQVTYTKMIKKEDGLLDLKANPEENLKKILAYSTWPGAYFFYEKRGGKKIRVNIIDAEIQNSELKLLRVVPAGKKEMNWSDFLRGNS
ncbi:MAG: methionyl-tRNA formyltransferase [bacterium]